MADNSFTFWANMKEAIDAYEGNPQFQYRLYDALTEYALYDVWPEDDGTMEAKSVIAFVQSMVPSVEKSKNFNVRAAEAGIVGGRRLKVTDDQIRGAIYEAAKDIGGTPTRGQIVEKLEGLYGVRVSEKTISRRVSEAEKKSIIADALK